MTSEADKSVFRWGGLASIASGLLFIGVFAWVIVLAGADPAGPDGPIIKFPEIRAVRTVENSLYLGVLMLWVPVYPALYRALRGTSPASATFGSALSLLGLGVLAAGAVPHIVTARLAELYHAPGATPDDQATLVVVWQAVQGIFDALLVTGLLLVAVGIAVMGFAMPARLGKAIATVSVILGLASIAAGVAVLIDPVSLAAALGIFALIAFHLAVGWKLFRLSKAV